MKFRYNLIILFIIYWSITLIYYSIIDISNVNSFIHLGVTLLIVADSFLATVIIDNKVEELNEKKNIINKE